MIKRVLEMVGSNSRGRRGGGGGGVLARREAVHFRQPAPQTSFVQSLTRSGGHVSAHVRREAASAAAVGRTGGAVASSHAAEAGQGAGALHTRGAVYTGSTLHLAAVAVAAAALVARGSGAGRKLHHQPSGIAASTAQHCGIDEREKGRWGGGGGERE